MERKSVGKSGETRRPAARPLGIRELARQLDISIGTVSRALNGRGEVNAETRKRVQEAAKRLGYVPNQSGRSLRQGATHTVALMMRTNVDRTTFGETFFLTLADGLQHVLARHDLDLVLLPYSTADSQDDQLRRAVERHLADAFIISDTQRVDRRIDVLLERGIPFVALGRSLTGGAHAWIDLDFEGVARESVARLVDFGHRRIALGVTTRDINNRFVFEEAYRGALAARGIPFDPALVLPAPTTEEGGYELGRMLIAMPNRPSAIILAQETLAIGLYRSLAEHGLEPGRDMSVIGFRQNPSTRFLSPAMTCFSFSLRDLGERLGEALVAIMRGTEDGAEPPHQLWPMTLVPGGSDGPASN